MGTYFELVAKPGCEDQINAAYAASLGKEGNYLVYSDKIIESEIAYIHSPKGKGQEHMRAWLHTVRDWNQAFPAFRSGTGQIKLSVDDDESINKIKLIIKFVLENRMLFKSVKGLDDARRFGYCDFQGDLIEDNKTKKRPPSDEPTFDSLPRGRSDIYKRCVEHNRPDLWNAYLKFKANPSDQNWRDLRTKTVPWKGLLLSLWEMVEKLSTQKDGKDFGLRGRFCDGNVPPLTVVCAALGDFHH